MPTSWPARPPRTRCGRSTSNHAGAGSSWGCTMPRSASLRASARRQHYDQESGVAVFLGAGNFSQGGWKAGAMREGFRKVVQQPSRPIMDDRPDRLVIVDELRTSRVSSSVHARQPCELHLPPDRPRLADWIPPASQVNQRLVCPACSLRHAKYVRGLQWCHAAPPWGRWLDRDTYGCLNLQRIGESMQRPIELCSYEGYEGDEYQQGFKLVNDRLPKGRQRLHRAAEFWRGMDSPQQCIGPSTLHRL
ncbi:hypothetical protein HaLaN_19041 [Haematococcus lacustris]|uniref:Uncharacterized protein n=1 Tax=Haematococcus lacustris TaxID=44745 RepID=A0A699ZSH0_HAELA|nr:hypothetical protein HaLaN_19041 [Haematococcus lacustris]